MSSTPYRIFFLTLLLSIPLGPASAKDTIGWVENVRLYPGELILKAKIDTGAKTSSLNCTCNQIFKKNGEEWLRFSVVDYRGNHQQIEKKVQRIARIRRHFGEVQERYVVNMDICLAGHRKTIEVTVIDREGFNYQMLIGRSALRGEFLVDPGRTFSSTPKCN
jgi:hypothetical protein